jgi:hypothetical protein
MFQGLLPNHPLNTFARATEAAEIVIAHVQAKKSNKLIED